MSDALDRLSREAGIQRQQVAGSVQLAREAPGIIAGTIDELAFGAPEMIARLINDEATEKWIRENESGFRKGEFAGTVGGSFIPTGSLLGRGLGAAGRALQGGRTAGTLARVGGALQGAGRFMRGTNQVGGVGRAIAQGAGRGAIEGGIESGIRAATNRRDVGSEVLGGIGFGAAGGAAGTALSKGLESLGELQKGLRAGTLGRANVRQRDLMSMLRNYSGPGSTISKNLRADDYVQDVANLIHRNPDLMYDPNKGEVIDAIRKQITGELDKAKNVFGSNASAMVDNAISRSGLRTPQRIRETAEAFGIEPKEVENALKTVERSLVRNARGGQFTSALGIPRQGTRLPRAPQVPRKDLISVRDGLQNIIDATNKDLSPIARIRHTAAKDLKYAIDNDLIETFPQYQQALKDYRALSTISMGEAAGQASVARPTQTGSTTMEKLATGSIIGGLAGGGSLLGSQEDDPDKIRNALLSLAAGSVAGGMGARGIRELLNYAGSTGEKAIIDLLANPKASRIAEVIMGGTDTVLGKKLPFGLRTPNLSGLAQAAGRGGASMLATSAEATRADQAARDRESLAPSEPEQADQLGEAAADAQQTPEARAEYKSLVQQKLYQRFVEMYPLYAEDDDAFGQFVAGAERASEGFDPRRTAKLLFPREDDRKAFLAAYQTQQTVGQTIPNIGVENKGGLFGFGATPLTLEQQGARATLEGAFLEASKLANIEPRDARKILEQVLDSGLSAAEKRQAILNQTRAWNQIGFEKLQAVGLG